MQLAGHNGVSSPAEMCKRKRRSQKIGHKQDKTKKVLLYNSVRIELESLRELSKGQCAVHLQEQEGML